MEYTKEFRERDELLGQLADRGLAIPDPTVALNFLTRVGYFRSGAYRYVFRRLLPPEKIDARLHVLAFMLRSHSSGSNWHLTFKTQIKKLDIKLQAPDGTELLSPNVSMGFPADWLDLDLWKLSS